MDLLSLVGMVAKRKGDYLDQAERLAKRYKTLEKLEDRMSAEAKVIVKGLRDRQMKFDEYERAMVDKTVTAALASVYLGSGESQPREKMDRSFSGIVGTQLTPLIKFLSETKTYLDNGILKYDDDSVDFAEDDETAPWFRPGAFEDWNVDELLGGDPGSPEEEIEAGDAEATQGSAVGKTWKGVKSRVDRYLVTPLYSFFQLGRFFGENQKGSKEMRRVARHDKRTCPDCVRYDEMGWQPIGSLPMPGKGCRCHDRCRCHIEYR
jgi:hypothetical protein